MIIPTIPTLSRDGRKYPIRTAYDRWKREDPALFERIAVDAVGGRGRGP